MVFVHMRANVFNLNDIEATTEQWERRSN